MNEFGEPNMGNPSVRFDEGRERVGHWPLAFQSNGSCLLYKTEKSLKAHAISGCSDSVPASDWSEASVLRSLGWLLFNSEWMDLVT
jgi:hypothetical protein